MYYYNFKKEKIVKHQIQPFDNPQIKQLKEKERTFKIVKKEKLNKYKIILDVQI